MFNIKEHQLPYVFQILAAARYAIENMCSYAWGRPHQIYSLQITQDGKKPSQLLTLTRVGPSRSAGPSNMKCYTCYGNIPPRAANLQPYVPVDGLPKKRPRRFPLPYKNETRGADYKFIMKLFVSFLGDPDAASICQKMCPHAYLKAGRLKMCAEWNLKGPRVVWGGGNCPCYGVTFASLPSYLLVI